MTKQNQNLMDEANRCLLCKNARCSKNCPIHTAIPEVIALYKEGKKLEAGEILFQNNPLSAICAIVCPHEDQCRGNCIRGIKGEPIDFPAIEKEVSAHYLDQHVVHKDAPKNQNVAIVGGGPAGITIALILAERGYDITLFDAHEKIGGVLRYGIPEFRLSRDLLEKYEEKLIELGVQIRPNTLIGPVLTLDKLFEDGYEAIFIGTGVWNPKTLGIKGESLGHVHYAIDYLKAPNVYRLGEKVCVIGAGNVAMDAARTAKRNGAKEVHVLYRKGFENMSATNQEIQEAKEDGVIFHTYRSPVACTKEGLVYEETDTEERKQGLFECDSIIIAISQNPRNNIVANTKGLDINGKGLLVTNEKGHTTKEGVFASGDVVTGAKTVVEAVHHAKIVADEMEAYLQSK